MQICNAMVFRNGVFSLGGISFGETFADVGPYITSGDLDAEGMYLIPGLIDIHSHAAMGYDASDGDEEGLSVMARYYAAGGVTSWCPTTMTAGEPVLTAAVRTIRRYRRQTGGAKIAGINLEGPFVSREKCGAQNPASVCAPDLGLFLRLNEASGGLVRLITVAPEEPGAIEFIRSASRVCRVSLGHTAADYDTAMAAYAAGASHTTHLFNAMTPLHHRKPGVIAAAMDASATVELICDGLHVHPAMVRLAYRLFGDKLALISDSVRCAGMPDGEYELGGLPITVKSGRAVLRGTDTLAGSSIHLMEGMRRAIAFGLSPADAVTAATAVPARIIGQEDRIGSIDIGKCADFVLLDKEWNVKAVCIDGEMTKKAE